MSSRVLRKARKRERADEAQLGARLPTPARAKVVHAPQCPAWFGGVCVCQPVSVAELVADDALVNYIVERGDRLIDDRARPLDSDDGYYAKRADLIAEMGFPRLAV